MSGKQKAVVASGHDLVSGAAAEILAADGNAFDAVVGAGFAQAVVEPSLTSLGGGGFMLAYEAATATSTFFDFFVDTPGQGLRDRHPEVHFFPVTINFSGASQVFNVGLGSVAVPGTLKGLLHIHTRLGRMPRREVLEPARRYAQGHLLNNQQAHFLQLLQPIMTLMPEGRDLYQPGGSYVTSGHRLENRMLARYLEEIAEEGDGSFYQGEIAHQMAKEMAGGAGLLTAADLANYRVYERKPLQQPCFGATLLTAPEPSVGGTLIALQLALAGQQKTKGKGWDDVRQLRHTVWMQKEVERLRKSGVTTPARLQAFLAGEEGEGRGGTGPLFCRGTTHVSIADGMGNCASMTCSNGEGSGYFAPHTGIMLNNMMGEDDLHPDGFHSSPPGQRVQSMMAPSFILGESSVRLVIGSGGSKRIRTAISQVLRQVLEYNRGLEEAIRAPRLHWDEECVQLEPGFPETVVEALGEVDQVRVWRQLDVYFGGVHGVIPGEQGVGDPRRGGSALEVAVP